MQKISLQLHPASLLYKSRRAESLLYSQFPRSSMIFLGVLRLQIFFLAGFPTFAEAYIRKKKLKPNLEKRQISCSSQTNFMMELILEVLLAKREKLVIFKWLSFMCGSLSLAILFAVNPYCKILFRLTLAPKQFKIAFTFHEIFSTIE